MPLLTSKLRSDDPGCATRSRAPQVMRSHTGQGWIVVHGHTAPYLNESSMKGLRAYGPSFSGNNKFLNLCLTSKTNILL